MIKADSLPITANVNRKGRIWSELGLSSTFFRSVLLYTLSCAHRLVDSRWSSPPATDDLQTNFREVFAVTVAALTVLMAGANAYAAFYYVDARVIQSGSGRDWSHAWKSLDAIRWSQIKGGDTIFISGGTAGLTYTAPLRVAASGRPGNRIRIVRATTPGRNGRVLIDGRNRNSSCVIVDGFNHISIEKLAIANCTDEGVRIRNAKDVIASGHSIFALSRGFHIWRTTGVIASYNTITTPTWLGRQNDGIYSQENVGNFYWANNIVISNGYPHGHNDGIQSYRDHNIIIGRNYIEQRNKKTGNALGIFLTDSYGNIRVFNNIVIGRYTRNSLVCMLNVSRTGGALSAYNNTLVGSKWGLIQINNAPRSTITNNILYSLTPEAAGITIAGAFPPADAINYNVYFLPNGRVGYQVTGQSYDWHTWRAMGYEVDGKVSSTSPIGTSFSPAVGSVALDAGLRITAVDQSGRSRPRGPGFDIGAVEK